MSKAGGGKVLCSVTTVTKRQTTFTEANIHSSFIEAASVLSETKMRVCER